MGNVFLKISSIICTLSILAPVAARAAACAPVEGSVPVGQPQNIAACNAIEASAQACATQYSEQMGIATTQEAQAKSFQGAAAAQAAGTLANAQGGASETGGASNAAAGASIAQANAPSTACITAAGSAETAARTYEALMSVSKQAQCTIQPSPLDIGRASGLKATCQKHVSDNGGIMSGLSKAAIPLAALAAGALGGFMMGKSSGGDDEKTDDATEGTPAAAGAAPAAPAEDSCGANAEKNAAGLCVVKSEDDTCYAADGKTEDKSKVRDSKGVCVSTSSLCQTGYDYDTVNKVCKKSSCSSGFSENELGECISNGTGGNTIAVGSPDPIVGEDPNKKDEETLAEKLAKNKAKSSGSASTSSTGGSARNAAAAASSGKGSGSFQASGGGTGRGGSGGGFGGGGFAANGGGADGAAGKVSEVQYQPVKWANPKKDRPLRDVLRK